MDENNDQMQQDEPRTPTVEEFEKVLNNKNQILREKKEMQSRLAEFEAQEETRKQEELEKQGKYQEALTTEREKLKSTQDELLQLQAEIRNKTLHESNYGIATELTKDTRRAKLLEQQIAAYAVYEGGAVSYELNGTPIQKEQLIEHLREEFDFLVDGHGGSGAGASGQPRGGAATKAFNEMNSSELSALRKQDPTAYERAKNAYYNR